MCQACGCHGGANDRVIMRVEGLNNQQSQDKVVKALLGLPGVLHAHANLKVEKVAVDFDNRLIHREQLGQALTDIGFTIALE